MGGNLIYEYWRPVVGHPDYLVSDCGRVWVYPRFDVRGRRLHAQVMTLSRAPSGHFTVSIDSKSQFIHRLVLSAFVRPPEDGEVCRHMDGKPWNNLVGNLQWGTPKDNALDRIRHGTSGRLDACGRGHKFVEGSYYVQPNGVRSCKACTKGRASTPEAKERRTALRRARGEKDAQAAREAMVPVYAEAWDLHQQGWTHRDISRKVPLHDSTISRFVTKMKAAHEVH